MKQQIESLIRSLEAEKKSIDKKLALAYQLRDDGQPQPDNHKPTRQQHRGAGFVKQILPILQTQGPQNVDYLFKQLRAQPGMRQITRASFESTLYSEVKKAKPRLYKVTPGVYAAYPPAFAASEERPPDAA